MKKFNSILMALVMAGMPAAARQLTPAEALTAAGLPKAATTAKVLKAPSAQFKLAYTATAQDFNGCYVFNRADNTGFVVLSADDAATPVLGYSDESAFDPANIPSGLKYMLETYTEQIQWASEHPDKVRSYTTTEREPVATICKTKWNQGSPYCLLCPVMGNYYAVTGCVATAMAQVMKAHNWPATGVGSHSYSWTYSGTTYTASTDFSSHNYDWDNMLDTYGSSASTTEKNAVAQLMYDCGVSVDMSYSPSASGANGNVASQALVNYFNYDKGMSQYYRDNFYINEWNDLAYAEVAAGRPTLICGSNSEGGHAFVCDGYSENDLFHINWGWGGMSDGYFLLSALDPDQQGIGGSSAGYTGTQRMAVGIQPPVAGSSIKYNIANRGGFFTGATSYSRSSAVTFGSSSTGFYNMTLGVSSISGYPAVKLVNTATQEVTYVVATSGYSDIAYQYGYRSYNLAGNTFPSSGTYIVTPAFKLTDGTIFDIRPDVINSTPLYLEASSSTLVFSNPEAGSIEISDFEVLSDAYIGLPLLYKFKISNSTPEMAGELSTSLCIKVGANYTTRGTGTTYRYDLLKGESDEATWSTTFTKSGSVELTARQYYLVFKFEGTVLAAYPVTFKENPGDLATGTPAFYSLNPDGEVALGTRSQAIVINRNYGLRAELPVTSGYLSDMAGLTVVNGSSANVASETAKSYLLNAVSGQTASFEVPASIFDELVDDQLYYVKISTANNGNFPATISIRYPIFFKLTSASGISDIQADAQEEGTIQWYNLQGVRVNQPQAGQVYLQRVTSANGTTTVKRIVKK